MNEGKIRSKHCARDRKEGQQPHLIGEHVATYIPGCTSSNSWMSGFFVCMCVCVILNGSQSASLTKLYFLEAYIQVNYSCKRTRKLLIKFKRFTSNDHAK